MSFGQPPRCLQPVKNVEKPNRQKLNRLERQKKDECERIYSHFPEIKLNMRSFSNSLKKKWMGGGSKLFRKEDKSPDLLKSK